MAIADTIRNAIGMSKKDDGSFNYKKMKEVVDKIFNSDDNKKIIDKQNRFLKRYKGEWWDITKLKPTDSTIQANLFFATVMTIAPLLTDNRPIWGIRARKPYLQNHVDGYSLGLEYLWDKLDLDMVTFKWAVDALVMKIGIVKCYFDPEAEFGGENCVELVDPRTFFCAPGYDDIWKSPLCGIRVNKPLSWIRMRYPDTGKNVQAIGVDGKDEKVSMAEQSWELDNKFATVYEVWIKDQTMEDYYIKEFEGTVVETDKKDPEAQKKSRPSYPNGRIVTFTKDALLDDKPSQYKHGKPPYVHLYDYIIPHELVGMGEGDQIEEINKSFNRNLQLIDAWTKYYCDPPWLLNTMSGLEVEKVKEELTAGGGFFEHNGVVAEPITKVPGANLDQAVPMFMSMLQKLNEEITGVTDITKGMVSKSQRQSATEISTLTESAYTRTRQRVRNFEWSIKRLLYLVLSNSQQFYSEPRNFSLGSDQNVNYYTIGNSRAQALSSMGIPNEMQYRQNQTPPDDQSEEDAQIAKDYEAFIADYGEVDEIYADFDLEVQTNSSLPMDRQSLANLFLRLLEMANSNPATGIPMWKAALENLKVPKYKSIISQMEEMFKQQSQPPAPPAETGGPPGLGQMIGGLNG